jgi:hypothetical protein
MRQDDARECLGGILFAGSSQCAETPSFGASLRNTFTLGWRVFASSRLMYA